MDGWMEREHKRERATYNLLGDAARLVRVSEAELSLHRSDT
jgi:hypothetical protein